MKNKHFYKNLYGAKTDILIVSYLFHERFHVFHHKMRVPYEILL